MDIIKEKSILEFQSAVPPSTNHYNSWRAVPTNKERYVTVKGKKRIERVYIPQAYASKEYNQFKKEFLLYLKKIVKQYKWDIQPTQNTHYYLDVDMYFDRVDKDSNNYFKCPLDVGNEVIYIDDRTIVVRCNRVYYTSSKQISPHFEYKLYPVDYIGIFNSEEEYNQFIENCKSCRNYKEGKCGRLKKYMEYRITDDFDWENRNCLGYKEKSK